MASLLWRPTKKLRASVLSVCVRAREWASADEKKRFVFIASP